jgi:2-dehydro-3-deoxygluconokinase
MRRLIALGECMIELRGCLADRPSLGFGGDTLNTAVYAARTAHGGLDVAYVTALGDDPFSARMMASWEAEGVATDLVRRLEGRLPGLYAIETDATGERRFYYWRDRAAARDLLLPEAAGDALLARLGAADLVYLSGISLAVLDPSQRRRLLEALARHRRGGVQVAVDTNLRPALWPDLATAADWLGAALRTADIALVSFDDERRLFDDATPADCATRIAAAGPREIVVKQGASGALLQVDGAAQPVPPVPASAVADTTAAGDSFNGAYLAVRLMGGNPVDAAAAGAELASHVVRHTGALIPKERMPI